MIRLYSNKELTVEVLDKEFDLGVNIAGETKQYTFWIKNDANSNIRDLQFLISHPEVFIVEAPKELFAYDNDKLVLEWRASVTVREGIRVRLHIKAIELCLPPKE